MKFDLCFRIINSQKYTCQIAMVTQNLSTKYTIMKNYSLVDENAKGVISKLILIINISAYILTKLVLTVNHKLKTNFTKKSFHSF